MTSSKPPKHIVGDLRNAPLEIRTARRDWIRAQHEKGVRSVDMAKELGISPTTISWHFSKMGLNYKAAPITADRLWLLSVKVGSTSKMIDAMPQAARNRLMDLAAAGDGTIAGALVSHFTKSFSEKRA